MSRTALVALALGGLVLSAGSMRGADGWQSLRRGMSSNETSAAVGDPLLKNRGRGFELWLYDGGAEVVCYRGMLVAWTAPSLLKNPSAAVPKTVTPEPAVAAAPPNAARLREQLFRVYDKFPSFRTEIRM